MARTVLHLVRHGEQDRDEPGAEGGLSPLGREQADRLGRRLTGVDYSRIHHSPLARAVQTTDVLAHHLPTVARHPCDLVTDRTPVPSAGRRGEYPERWLSWLDGVPDEERDEDAAALRGAVENLGVTGGVDRCELVVTHGFVIGWFVAQVLQAPEWRWIGLDSANCGLTVLTWESGRPPVVVAFNDTGHL